MGLSLSSAFLLHDFTEEAKNPGAAGSDVLYPALTVFQGPFLLEQLSCYLTFSRACHLEDLFIHPKKCILVVLFRKVGVKNISKRLKTFLPTDLFICPKVGFYIGTTFDLVEFIFPL